MRTLSNIPSLCWVSGGIGTGDRVFPPATGLTYSTWFNVERYSNSRADPHCVRLLTLVSQAFPLFGWALGGGGRFQLNRPDIPGRLHPAPGATAATGTGLFPCVAVTWSSEGRAEEGQGGGRTEGGWTG